jgi:indole-3-glycerol phosphate synthase
MILDNIVEATAARVAGLPELPAAGAPHGDRRSLVQAVEDSREKNAVIAEIKFASPSRGRIREGSDPAGLAAAFASAGACALSVLTEPYFFRGSTEYLGLVRGRVPVPVLRKDFIIDERQLAESRDLGADAVLLITAVLGERLEEFLDTGQRFGLESLVEVHTRDEVKNALDCGAGLIGVNNRDLRTFRTDLSTTLRLAPLAREGGAMVIAESGITWPSDVKALRRHAQGFLIGSAIMGSPDPVRRLEGFVFA